MGVIQLMAVVAQHMLDVAVTSGDRDVARAGGAIKDLSDALTEDLSGMG